MGCQLQWLGEMCRLRGNQRNGRGIASQAGAEQVARLMFKSAHKPSAKENSVLTLSLPLDPPGGFPGGTVIKESACQCRRLKFDPWVGKIPWRRKWQPTSVFLLWKFHGQRRLAGYSPWGGKELNTAKWLSPRSKFHVNEITQGTTFWNELLLLTHLRDPPRLLSVSTFLCYFYDWVAFCCMNGTLFIHSPVEGLWGCFLFWVITIGSGVAKS